MTTEPPARFVDRQIAELAILSYEHSRRFKDKLVYTDMYASQITYLNVFATLVIGMAGLMASFGDLDSDATKFGAVIGLILAAAVLFYLLSTLLDALYHLYANLHQMAYLETEINELFGKELLLWDSRVLPKLHPTDRLFVEKPLVSPSIFLAFWSVLLVLVLGIAMVSLWHLTVGRLTYVYGGLLGIGLGLVGHQWFNMHTAGSRFLRSVTSEVQAETANSPSAPAH